MVLVVAGWLQAVVGSDVLFRGLLAGNPPRLRIPSSDKGDEEGVVNPHVGWEVELNRV